MNKILKFAILAVFTMFAVACTRIETGEVGIRVGFDKQVVREELLPGSFNQVLIGDVITFPVKDVQVDVKDLSPLASDNSTIKDFDVAIVYSLNPTSVAEIYIEKNRGFHAIGDGGDVYLMYNYVQQLGRNAVYSVARKYEALKMNDSRPEIEQQIRDAIIANLQEEQLNNAISIQQVFVRQILPSDGIVESANSLVQAQNELKKKRVEVETAKQEAERIAALNANAGAVEYMQAMATVTLAEAVREGKVNTIVIPYDFKGIVNVPEGAHK